MPGSFNASIRKITNASNIPASAFKDSALKTTSLGLANRFANKTTTERTSFTLPNISPINKTNVTQFSMAQNNRNNKFNLPPGGKCVLNSDCSDMEKAFCSLNLSSMTFVGFMGDFAVWAITDAFTGEIMYLVDDNV